MLRGILAAILLTVILFGVPLIPIAAVWWLLSPVGFIQILITIFACIIIYVPLWFFWLILCTAMVES